MLKGLEKRQHEDDDDGVDDDEGPPAVSCVGAVMMICWHVSASRVLAPPLCFYFCLL